MNAVAITKEFGVIATDSASWNPIDKSMAYEAPKLFYVGGKHLMTFVGFGLFFDGIDKEVFKRPFDSVCVYLSDFLRDANDKAQSAYSNMVKDDKDKSARICVHLLSAYDGKPMVAQFNSFTNFTPTFTMPDSKIKFSSIFYGDDSEKNNVFKKSTEFMEEMAMKHEQLTPGIVGEILTRGIYHKADLEQKIGDKKKYAGGTVSVGVVFADGTVIPASNLLII